MSFTDQAADSANSELTGDADEQKTDEMTQMREARRHAVDVGSVSMASSKQNLEVSRMANASSSSSSASSSSSSSLNARQAGQVSTLSIQSPPLDIHWTPVSGVQGSHMTVSQYRQQQRANKHFPSVLLHSPSTRQAIKKPILGATEIGQTNTGGVSVLGSQFIATPLVRSISSSSSSSSSDPTSSNQTLPPSSSTYIATGLTSHLGRPALASRPYSHSSVALPAPISSLSGGASLPSDHSTPFHSTAFTAFTPTSMRYPSGADNSSSSSSTSTMTNAHHTQLQTQHALTHSATMNFHTPFDVHNPVSGAFSLPGSLTSHAMEQSYSNLSSPLPRGYPHSITAASLTVGTNDLTTMSKVPSTSAQSAFSMSFKPATTTNRRVSAACNFCVQRKLRCDGQSPCRQCARRSLACVFSEAAETRKRRRRAATVTGGGRTETVANVGLTLPTSTPFNARSATYARGMPHGQLTPSAGISTAVTTPTSITTPTILSSTTSESPFFITRPSPPLSATLPTMPYTSSSPSLPSPFFALPAQRQGRADGMSQQALSAWALQELGLGNAGGQTDMLSVPQSTGYNNNITSPASDSHAQQSSFADHFAFSPGKHDLPPSRPS